MVASSFALFAPRGSSAPSTAAQARSRTAGWRLSIPTAIGWSVAAAFFMSTQYLVQPFVWTHWPVDQVLLGWLETLRDRVLVAVLIAMALVLATCSRVRTLAARAGLIAIAIVCGAIAGELALLALGVPGVRAESSAVAGRIAQWSGLTICLAGMYYLWMRINDVRAAARSVEVERSATEAMLVQVELQSLRQQIEPHFLFNTLATIRRLHETEPMDGAALLRHLSAYLGSTARSTRQNGSLGDEVALIESYLAIIAIRMTGRLQVTIDVPQALRAHLCPPLVVATLAENAVKHGITPAPHGGRIVISARCEHAVLEIAVADTGVGIAESGGGGVGGAGIGLSNIRARLRAMHGTAASLALARNVPHGVRAVIRMPCTGCASR